MPPEHNHGVSRQGSHECHAGAGVGMEILGLTDPREMSSQHVAERSAVGIGVPCYDSAIAVPVEPRRERNFLAWEFLDGIVQVVIPANLQAIRGKKRLPRIRTYPSVRNER